MRKTHHHSRPGIRSLSPEGGREEEKEEEATEVYFEAVTRAELCASLR